MVSIARKNLFLDLPRFIVAQAGIMFAVGLVTIQTGLLNGFTQSSSNLVDQATADLWVAHEDMRHLDLTVPIPYEWVEKIQQVQGVSQSEALMFKGAIWRYALEDLALVRVIGFDPQGTLFQPKPVVQGDIADLETPNSIFVDTLDQSGLDVSGMGHTVDIGAYSTEVVGLTKGLGSIVSNPYVLTSLETANTLLTSPVGQDPAPAPIALQANTPINFVLVKAQAGESLEDLRQRIQTTLPESRVVLQSELAQITQDYWRNSTGVGYILGLGAVVGIIVGTVVVGQILYSSVSDHIREFGTLKAMGAPDTFIYQIILEQAFWMAVLGYIPGLALSLGVGILTVQAQAVQILISPATAGLALVITIAMCSGAAIFAIQKVTRLDPAMVFKS